MSRWKVLAARTLVDRPWIRIREEHVVLPSGVEIEGYHLVEQTEWVCVVPLTDDGRIVLVEQYRHGLGATSLELPAGMIETGESPLDAARRELREETGYAADDWAPLGRLSPDPPRTAASAHLFFAKSARRIAEQSFDETEDIRVLSRSIEETLRLVDEGGILHAVHVAALHLAQRKGVL